MMRNMCFRIESISLQIPRAVPWAGCFCHRVLPWAGCFCHRVLPWAGCFCPFRARTLYRRYPGCYPGLTALWPFRPLADSLLPRLMSGEIKVGDVTL